MRSPRAAFDLRAALSEEVGAALVELDSADGRPKAIHRCRVRLKRARALARIGRACAPGLAAVFEDSARAAMGALSRERDLTAQADSARMIAAAVGKKAGAALDAIAEEIEAERDALPKLDTEATRAALKDLHALAMVWPEASARQIERGANRVIRRARRARKKGADAAEPALRHLWRKREKDRLYAALLLGDAFPAKRRRKLGERLGEWLGRERDALLLLDRLAASPPPVRAKSAARAVGRYRERLGKRADALGARLHADRA